MNTVIYIAGILLMLLIYFLNGQKSLKLKIKSFALILLLVNACFINGNFLLVQYGLTLLLLLALNNVADKELSAKNIKREINLLIVLWLLDGLSVALNLPMLLRLPVFCLLAQLVSVVYFFQFRKFSSDLTYILGMFVFNILRMKDLLDLISF